MVSSSTTSPVPEIRQAVTVQALAGLVQPGVQPVQQGLRLGPVAGPRVVEGHGCGGGGVLEVALRAPEGTAAQVVRGGGVELQGQALQDLGVALPAGVFAGVLGELVQPERGKGQPGHVVVVVVDHREEIAQPDARDEPGGEPAGAGPVLAVELGSRMSRGTPVPGGRRPRGSPGSVPATSSARAGTGSSAGPTAGGSRRCGSRGGRRAAARRAWSPSGRPRPRGRTSWGRRRRLGSWLKPNRGSPSGPRP